VDKIRDVIGPGGKVIRGIIEQTGAAIDVEDDGTVRIASPDMDVNERAIKMIKDLTAEPEVGAIYEGTVVRITDFGAFVEIMPGRDGLLHISEIENRRIEKVTDVLHEGDKVVVKCLRVDPDGKVGLSRKAVLDQQPPQADRPRNDAEAPMGARPYHGERGSGGGERGDRPRGNRPDRGGNRGGRGPRRGPGRPDSGNDDDR
jgi:polyribonucleotide nucleotidyltransferase